MVAQTAYVGTTPYPYQSTTGRGGTLNQGIEGGDHRESHMATRI